LPILPVPIAKQIIEEPTLEAFFPEGDGAAREPLVSVGYAP
jgi:hypothetical protein